MAKLYHGTNEENFNQIKKSGYIKGPAFFTPRKDVAINYAPIVIEVEIPDTKLLIDLDLPGAALVSVARAREITGNPDWTIREFLRYGFSVGTKSKVKI
jgi:hypothetical protein